MSLSLPKCSICKHCKIENGDMVCIAYPKGIPVEAMFTDENDECANSIKYEEEQIQKENRRRKVRE